ncbi:hypothetical protein [Vibrio lentus]|uniref:hypothetical protein n=1 Tax=Vibrio lentus TaxID=136468 RepID=UPI0039A49E65
MNTTSEEDVDNTYGISADYAFSNFSAGTSYITGEAEKDIDYSLAGVSSASAEFGALTLALTYAQFEGANEFGYWEYKGSVSDKDAKGYFNGDTNGLRGGIPNGSGSAYTQLTQLQTLMNELLQQVQ